MPLANEIFLQGKKETFACTDLQLSRFNDARPKTEFLHPTFFQSASNRCAQMQRETLMKRQGHRLFLLSVLSPVEEEEGSN